MLALLVVGVPALILMNAFFVAAEYALVRARRDKVEALEQEGARGAKLAGTQIDRIDEYIAAFQDASRAQSRIALVRVAGGARRGPALRVDDGGPAAGDAWRPRLSCSGGRVVVAFETERDGPGQVYVTSAPLERLR